MTGFIVQGFGSFRPALLTGASIGFASAPIYGLGVRRSITVAEITPKWPARSP